MSDFPVAISPGDLGHIAHHELLATLFDELYTQGTLSQRPSAGVARRTFYATDTSEWFRDDGAAWHPVMMGDAVNHFTTSSNFADTFFGSGRPWVAVRHSDYGAVGDGVADDYQPIVDACTFAPDGSIVWFDVGEYYIGTNVNGVTLTGRVGLTWMGPPGGKAVLKKNPAANANWATLVDCTDFTLWGLAFDYNGGSAQGGVGFYANSADGSFNGFRAYYCKAYDSAPQAYTPGVSVDRVWLVTNGTFIAKNIEIAFCQVNDIGIELDNVQDAWVHHNTFRDTRSTTPVGSFNGAASAKSCLNLKIEHNDFHDVYTNGIVVRNESAGKDNFTVDGVTVRCNRFFQDARDSRYLVAIGSFHGNATGTGNSFVRVRIEQNDFVFSVARTLDNQVIYLDHDTVALRMAHVRVSRNTIRIGSPLAGATSKVIDIRHVEELDCRENYVSAVQAFHYNFGSIDGGEFVGNWSHGATTASFAEGVGTTLYARNNRSDAPVQYQGWSTGDWIYGASEALDMATSSTPTVWSEYHTAPAGSNINTVSGGFEGAVTRIHATGARRFNNAAGGAGQVHLSGAADYAMGTDDTLTLQKRGADWYEVARSNN